MTEDIDLSTANSYDESTDDTSAFAAASYDDQQLVDETCQPWCNAHTCNDGRCTTCDVCEAGDDDGDNKNNNAGAQAGGGALVEESTGCAAWCVAEELYDTCGEVDQCGGCEACVAKRDAAAAAAGTTPCPTWYVCSHTRHILLFFSLPPSLLTTQQRLSRSHTHRCQRRAKSMPATKSRASHARSARRRWRCVRPALWRRTSGGCNHRRGTRRRVAGNVV